MNPEKTLSSEDDFHIRELEQKIKILLSLENELTQKEKKLQDHNKQLEEKIEEESHHSKEVAQENLIAKEMNNVYAEKSKELEVTKLNLKNVTLEKKNLSRELEKRKNEKFETLGQLAANLAHDLNNPLSVIKQSLEVFQLRIKDRQTSKGFQRIDRAVERISHQVDQVLDCIMITPLQTKDTTILTILRQSLGNVVILDNISIEIPKKDFEVRWDETKISALFSNIILNAVQVIGKDEGKISVRISEQNDAAKIEIENSGPNIPEKDLDKIFEPLYTTKMEGTGLGLAGCKNIIQSHKGTISVSNNPVKFTIELPKFL